MPGSFYYSLCGSRGSQCFRKTNQKANCGFITGQPESLFQGSSLQLGLKLFIHPFLLFSRFVTLTPTNSEAPRWGCDHVDVDRKLYTFARSSYHQNSVVSESGLHIHINSQYPQISATPDGMDTCSCCADGVLEIKCQFCHATCVNLSEKEKDGVWPCFTFRLLPQKYVELRKM